MAGAVHDVRPWRGQLVVLEATERSAGGRRVGREPDAVEARAGCRRWRAGPLKAALYYCRRPFSGTVLLGSTYEFAGYDLAHHA